MLEADQLERLPGEGLALRAVATGEAERDVPLDG
jgi:hypothetical protein